MKKTKTKKLMNAWLSGGGKAIPLFKVRMAKSVMRPLFQTLASGYVGQGPKVDKFERALAKWFKSPYVLSLNSCTSAIQLALRLSNVGYGDEVISTPMTCTATNEPIMAMGARIVWADINPSTGNICPMDIKKKITSKTKAIVVVHWGGYPCDLKEIHRIAKRRNIKVIEDAAHAFGASYHGKAIGSYSDFTCFSFQAIKHMTTVDGGALVCKRKRDYKRGKLLRWYGINRETNQKDFRCELDIKEYGYKFHMNDVTATIGLEQLKYANDTLKKCRDNARYYERHLKGIKHIELLDYKSDRKSAYWLFTFLVKKRLKFMNQMMEAGIVVSQVHARNDTHTMFKRFKKRLPGVDAFIKRQVSIPVGWWVTKKERAYIVKTIREICG